MPKSEIEDLLEAVVKHDLQVPEKNCRLRMLDQKTMESLGIDLGFSFCFCFFMCKLVQHSLEPLCEGKEKLIPMTLSQVNPFIDNDQVKPLSNKDCVMLYGDDIKALTVLHDSML